MIQKGSRVRHRDAEIDTLRGVMSVLEIKNGWAVCTYLDFHRLGSGAWTYNITDLKLSDD